MEPRVSVRRCYEHTITSSIVARGCGYTRASLLRGQVGDRYISPEVAAATLQFFYPDHVIAMLQASLPSLTELAQVERGKCVVVADPPEPWSVRFMLENHPQRFSGAITGAPSRFFETSDGGCMPFMDEQVSPGWLIVGEVPASRYRGSVEELVRAEGPRVFVPNAAVVVYAAMLCHARELPFPEVCLITLSVTRVGQVVYVGVAADGIQIGQFWPKTPSKDLGWAMQILCKTL